VRGGEAALEVSDEAIYLAISVRNVGTGLAVLLGWHVRVGVQEARSHPPLDEFAGQRRDIYVPPGDVGFWQGALRDPTAEIFKAVGAAIEASEPLVINVLYGDFEGGQRVISQFILRHQGHQCLVSAGRHFQLDQPDPREME
jgi:hypothetical protein